MEKANFIKFPSFANVKLTDRKGLDNKTEF